MCIKEQSIEVVTALRGQAIGAGITDSIIVLLRGVYLTQHARIVTAVTILAAKHNELSSLFCFKDQGHQHIASVLEAPETVMLTFRGSDFFIWNFKFSNIKFMHLRIYKTYMLCKVF